MAQTGLAFTKDPYDIGRYQRLQAIAAEMLAEAFVIDPIPLNAQFQQLSGYATPQVDVRGAVFREDQVLLVREATDGKWSLPGGWADVNLTAAENVVKEIKEESNVEAAVVKLAGVYDRSRHSYWPPEPLHCYKVLFVCAWRAGAPGAGDDTTAAGFFPLDALPPLSAGRIIEAHILRAYAHHRDPGLAPDFD